MDTSEARFRLLRLIDQHPDWSQRQLASHLGLSLGKAHYCLRALVDKGYVKLGNFRRSRNKGGYRYKLTPAGVVEKLSQTRAYLDIKREEFAVLQLEIERLNSELNEGGDASSEGAG
ncbi:MarR family EPS-associated transcriptional regulator [bacterium]|nr:MarR family EPS-associated transcriptional regulator [bacterium]